MNELFNLSEIDDAERASMKQRRIDFKKLQSQLSAKARKDSKPTKCLYCQKLTSKFCNSHSVPASFLKNIAVNGEVYTPNKIIDLPIFDAEKGVNNSGTFKVICRDCDSKIFKEYENPFKYEIKPTDKMIAQIAMKNHLRSIGKRRFEISLYQNMKKELSKTQKINPYINYSLNGMIDISTLDLNEYIKGFKRAKKVIAKNWNNEYYLFYYEKLDYVVPIAFQGEVSLNFDFLGHTINNVYNKSKKYKIQTLHISIFPLKSYSVIMMFIDKNDHRYRSFYKQFKKLEQKEKLAAINFIIFSLSEDIFMSKNVHDACINDENLQKIAGLTSIQFADAPVDNNQMLKDSFDFSEMNMIPNFLMMDLENVP